MTWWLVVLLVVVLPVLLIVVGYTACVVASDTDARMGYDEGDYGE